MGPLCTVLFTFAFAYRIYAAAQASNKWSWPIFFGTLGGVFAMAIVLISAMVFIITSPRKDQGIALLALVVAYITMLIALIAYCNRAYKRMLAKRGIAAT